MTASSGLSLRISAKDLMLIDRAAEATHKTPTEFLLDSARAAAADVLLDRNLFVSGSVEFKKLEKALKAAPTSTDVIGKLKKRPSPWKK